MVHPARNGLCRAAGIQTRRENGIVTLAQCVGVTYRSVDNDPCNTGDLVVADIDGVVVIPREDVKQIIRLAKEKLEMETKRLAAIREGDLRPHWLNDALRKAGMLADGETL